MKIFPYLLLSLLLTATLALANPQSITYPGVPNPSNQEVKTTNPWHSSSGLPAIPSAKNPMVTQNLPTVNISFTNK